MASKNPHIPNSTVGRSRLSSLEISSSNKTEYCEINGVHLFQGNSLELYDSWTSPNVIISDGAYGVLGFEGDTCDYSDLMLWYEPHVREWSNRATPRTTLWFWNTEIGWATVHPILEKYGWKYVNANIWNKGKSHIAGNVNTSTIRRFPVVSEVCVQYVLETKIDGLSLKQWLRKEWLRSGLPLRKANDACGVKDAATRKYFDQGHLWYFPPSKMFEKLAQYANIHGEEIGKPYFSLNGEVPLSGDEWEQMRNYFSCPHGVTNIWERPALHGQERVKIPGTNKAAHLNQKPLDLMELIIRASSIEDDIIWEPFGGMFTASLAALNNKRKAFAAEIHPEYYHLGVERFFNQSELSFE